MLIKIKKENVVRTVSEHDFKTIWEPRGFTRAGAAQPQAAAPTPPPVTAEPGPDQGPEPDRDALLAELHALGGSVHHNAGVPRIMQEIERLRQEQQPQQ